MRAVFSILVVALRLPSASVRVVSIHRHPGAVAAISRQWRSQTAGFAALTIRRGDFVQGGALFVALDQDGVSRGSLGVRGT